MLTQIFLYFINTLGNSATMKRKNLWKMWLQHLQNIFYLSLENCFQSSFKFNANVFQ